MRVAGAVVDMEPTVLGSGNVAGRGSLARRRRRRGVRRIARPPAARCTGWDVTLVERVAPGHVRAGSGDESRIIRCGHGEDAWHAALGAARAGRSGTRSTRRSSSRRASLWLAHRDDGWEAASERTLRAPRDPVLARSTRPTASRASPATTSRGGCGSPRPASCARATRRRRSAAQAVAGGAELVLAEARPDGDAVVLDDGRRLEADRVVWACGAWLPRAVRRPRRPAHHPAGRLLLRRERGVARRPASRRGSTTTPPRTASATSTGAA